MMKVLKIVARATVGYLSWNLTLAVGMAMPIVIALKEERYHDADMLVYHYRKGYGPHLYGVADAVGELAEVLTNFALKLHKEKRRVGFKA